MVIYVWYFINWFSSETNCRRNNRDIGVTRFRKTIIDRARRVTWKYITDSKGWRNVRILFIFIFLIRWLVAARFGRFSGVKRIPPAWRLRHAGGIRKTMMSCVIRNTSLRCSIGGGEQNKITFISETPGSRGAVSWSSMNFYEPIQQGEQRRRYGRRGWGVRDLENILMSPPGKVVCLEESVSSTPAPHRIRFYFHWCKRVLARYIMRRTRAAHEGSAIFPPECYPGNEHDGRLCGWTVWKEFGIVPLPPPPPTPSPPSPDRTEWKNTFKKKKNARIFFCPPDVIGISIILTNRRVRTRTHTLITVVRSLPRINIIRVCRTIIAARALFHK